VRIRREIDEHIKQSIKEIREEREKKPTELQIKIGELRKLLQSENVEDLAGIFVDLITKDCQENGVMVEELKTIIDGKNKDIKYEDFFKLIRVMGH
jgi:hypothetical protein